MTRKTKTLRASLNHAKTERERLESSLRRERKELSSHREKLEAAKRVRDLANDLARVVQQNVHSRISELVTKALASVFDEPYEFQIHFKRSRNSTVADIVLTRDGKEFDVRAIGGGVIDVIAFALRCSAIALSRRKVRRVLFLDEPFRMLSSAYRARVKLLIERISEELNIQIIQITHHEDLKIGKVIRIGD